MSADPNIAAGLVLPALDMLMDLELSVTLCFGRMQMTLEEILRLDTGSVIEFDREVQEPVEVLVNGHVVARGEAVMVQGCYAVRISEILSRSSYLDSPVPATLSSDSQN